MANEINKIKVSNTDYTIIDSTAVHTVDSTLSTSSENPVQNKIVKAECDNIRAVAEGKCKSYTLSYSDTALIESSSVTYYKLDGTAMTYAEAVTYVGNLSNGNNKFNDQSASISLFNVTYPFYFIMRKQGTVQYYIVLSNDVTQISQWKNGDVLLIIETDVPDRWIDTSSYVARKLETSKVDISGKVDGPASSTDNAVARFDSTTGKVIQNSSVTIDDSGNIRTSGDLTDGTNSVSVANIDTLNTAQTVSGTKTYSGGIIMSSAIRFNNSQHLWFRAADSESNYGSIFMDSSNVLYAYAQNGLKVGCGGQGAVLKDTNLTVTRTFQFPDSDGTIALTSDIPSVTDFVTGPSASTDNAIARFDASTGKIIQNSGITISDSNDISTLSVGDISLRPNSQDNSTTSRVVISDNYYRGHLAIGGMSAGVIGGYGSTGLYLCAYESSPDAGGKIILGYGGTTNAIQFNSIKYVGGIGYVNSYATMPTNDGSTSSNVYTVATQEWTNTKYTYSTTAPTAAITDGGIHIIVLDSEPATKYDGYIYLIKE